MEFSDWLQIILSLVGFVLGVGISYYFFRAQQFTDYNDIRRRLIELSNEVKTIRDNNEVIRQVEQSVDLQLLRSALASLDNTVKQAGSHLITEVRQEQSVLLSKIQQDFEQRIEKTRLSLEGVIINEVRTITPHTVQSDIILKLTNLIAQSLENLSKYHKLSTEEEAKNFLSTVENQVLLSVSKLTNSAREIGESVSMSVIDSFASQSQFTELNDGATDNARITKSEQIGSQTTEADTIDQLTIERIEAERNQDWPKWTSVIAQILQRHPDHTPTKQAAAKVLFDRGNSEVKNKQFIEALKRFNRAIRFAAQFPEAYAARGECYVQLKDFGNALIDFGKAIEPRGQEASYYRAVASKSAFPSRLSAV